MSASKKSPDYLATLAAAMVMEERRRQVKKKGYSRDHDDKYTREELAAAAAFYMLPSWLDQNVCFLDGKEGLKVSPLHRRVADAAWKGISRDYDDPVDDLELRITYVVRGCALGLAELERLLRLRKGEC